MVSMVERAIACKSPNLNYSVKGHFLTLWGALEGGGGVRGRTVYGRRGK